MVFFIWEYTWVVSAIWVDTWVVPAICEYTWVDVYNLGVHLGGVHYL